MTPSVEPLSRHRSSPMRSRGCRNGRAKIRILRKRTQCRTRRRHDGSIAHNSRNESEVPPSLARMSSTLSPLMLALLLAVARGSSSAMALGDTTILDSEQLRTRRAARQTSPMQREEQLHRTMQQEQQTSIPQCHHEGKWHASLTIPNMCTNDNAMPQSWEEQTNRDMFLFDGWLACCEVMFSGPHNCGKSDVCLDDAVPLEGSGVGNDSTGAYTYDSGHQCEGRLWHPDITASSPTCTNTAFKGNNYPSYWDNPVMKGLTMFDTPKECCGNLNGEGAINSNYCFVKESNDCVANDETGQYDIEKDDCEDGRKWHASKSKSETCTNDDDFPPAWSDAFYNGKTMFSSHTECCNDLGAFGLANCHVINICTDPLYTSGTIGTDYGSPSCAYPWHPNAPTFRGCSNSLPETYPNDWTHPDVQSWYLYGTHEDCCDNFFDYEDTDDCPKFDHCPDVIVPIASPIAWASTSPTTCDEERNRWHKGHTGPNICTNDLDYPLAWDDPTITADHLFDTVRECCDNFVDNEDMDTCVVVDICDKMSTTIDLNAPAKLSIQFPTYSPMQSSMTNELDVSPATDSPSHSPAHPPIDTAPVSLCAGKRKKRCANDPECNWVINSCVDGLVLTGSGELVNDGCAGIKYHPTNVLERKCTNDDNFPSIWSHTMDKYFFSSGQDCCAAFYDGGPCEVNNICIISSNKLIAGATTTHQNCHGGKWHPTSVLERTCTNSKEYPSSWALSPEKYFFGTAEKCCQFFYRDGNCNRHDICGHFEPHNF